MAKTEAETLQQISVWWMKSEGYFTNGTAPLLIGISFTATACILVVKDFGLFVVAIEELEFCMNGLGTLNAEFA